jgi:2-succinyl-5-enolpyruvyl-6-hydroxy-3-cyclohexene-1-carboxylate synthase
VNGASLSTLLHNARGHSHLLLVVRDHGGAIFGALITESLKIFEKEKYYGNGTIGVWSFVTGSLKVINDL